MIVHSTSRFLILWFCRGKESLRSVVCGLICCMIWNMAGIIPTEIFEKGNRRAVTLRRSVDLQISGDAGHSANRGKI